MRLIDADALKQKLVELYESDPYPENEYMDGWTFAAFSRDELKPIIDDAPTVEAEPIVRCKDCKNHKDEEPEMVYCPNVVGCWVPNNWFCADGERKDEEEKMAAISKELRELSQQPWFPAMMRELGYEPVKHGRWKLLGRYAMCTNCEDYWIPNGDQYDYLYCPHCGAKMDGGE